MIRSPLDNIIVQFDQKYQDQIITQSGIIFYKDTSFNPEWNTTVVGKVVSVPNRISSDEFKSCIVPEVQVGDELFFSYMVVHDKEMPSNPEYFFEVENWQHQTTYKNCLKEQIKVARWNKGKEGAGIYFDQNEERIDGIQGKYKEVEKWLSQFKIGQPEHEVFANLIWHDEDYWKVDYAWAIAVKRNDEIIMIGGNCLLEPPEERMVYEMAADRQLHLVTKIDRGRAKLLHIGTPLKSSPTKKRYPLDIKAGDFVRFDERFVQKYELWGKKYYVLGQDRILAKEV